MSDFFTRLAERALGLAQTIQPITPSMFAPDPDTGSELPFESAEEQVLDTSPPSGQVSYHVAADETLAVIPFERAQLEPFRPATASTRVSTASTNTPSASAGTSLQHEGAQGGLPRSGQPRQHPVQAQPFPSPIMEAREPAQRAETIVTRGPGVSRNIGYEEIAETRPEIGNGAFPPPPVERGYRGTSTDRKSETVATPGSASLQQPEGARHTLLGAPGVRGAQSSHGGQPALARSEAFLPEPAVQVTIGRIEVRAVTSPASSARQQRHSARPQVMSLDEYLRRQEQGGRR